MLAWTVDKVTADKTIDFYAYYLASECIARGVNPYEVSQAQWNGIARDIGLAHWAWPYRYPPQTAVALLAMRPLGPHNAAVVWGLLNGAALIAGAYILGRTTRKPWGPAASLLMLLLFYPVWESLIFGQIIGIVFFLLVLALWALNRGRGALAGASIAIATVLKVFPALLVVYVIWRRRWRCAAVALIVVVASFLVCLPFAGYDVVAAYPRHAMAIADPGRVDSTVYSQTLTSTVARLATGHLSTSAVLEISRVLGVIMLALTYGLCWPRGRFSEWVNLEYSLVIPLCVLLPGFNFNHWLVILLIPAVIVLERLVEHQRRLLLFILGGLFLVASAQWPAFTHLAGMWTALLASGIWRLLCIPFIFAVALWLFLASQLLAKFRRGTPILAGETQSTEQVPDEEDHSLDRID